MATSIADLLSATEQATHASGRSSFDIAAAAAAIGHLGRALDVLADAGTHTFTDWTMRDDRCRRLAAACADLARTAPEAEGRITLLAAATADAIGVSVARTTALQRWSTAVEVLDTLAPLLDVVRELPEGAGPHAVLEGLTTSFTQLQQDAATSPPSRSQNAALDAPIPAAWIGGADSERRGVDICEAVAAMLHAIDRKREPLTVAEVLALSMTAESVSRAVLAGLEPGEPHPARPVWPCDMTGVDGWAAVQDALVTLNDGSRRKQADVPDYIDAARSVYRLTREASHDDLADAAQHLPQLAEHLSDSTHRWPEQAHVWITVRERGQQRLLRADATALRPVAVALEDAKRLSTSLADTVGHQHEVASRRTWQLHHERRHTPEAIDRHSDAQARAYRHLSRSVAPPGRGIGR